MPAKKKTPRASAPDAPSQIAPRDASAALADAARAASVCDQYRGQETVVLDLTAITALFDFFVITTATNRRQMHSIADEVSRTLKRLGGKRLGREGYDGSNWIVEDFGDVILHIFTPESRALYDLENLWGDAPRVDWTQHLPE
ncbi:MAG: ribosome silencing factor [Planctomycetaceae bacterium]